MTNRITGTNSGIDVDAVVKASLSTEQNKIDKAYQQQKIYEYQQEQLREIVDQCTDFYDKYLDILSSDSLMKSSAYETISFTGDNNNVTAKGYAGAETGNYTIEVESIASKASTVIDKGAFKYDDKGNGVLSIKINDEEPINIAVKTSINDKDGSITVDYKATAEELNEKLAEKGLTAKFSEISGGLVIESKSTGSDQKFRAEVGWFEGSLEDFSSSSIIYNKQTITGGTDCEITINGSKIDPQSTNTFKLDNIEFTVNKTGTTELIGKNDGTQLKETIVNFINDYNNLITTINEKLSEDRDKDYMPLTEEQKSEMTESEIKKWEEKAQTGLLRNDNDLKRIQSALKESMRTFMSSSGLNLEAIGITPVNNYGTKNGTFTINEDKLTKAIEENPEGVKELFTKEASKDGNGSNAKGGILIQLQSVLKSETKSSGSALSKRIGFVGTSTENNNTLKRNIAKQKKLMSELKEKYATKETALYKKYSALETMLEKLNAQSNSLYSMLNIG